MDFEGVRAIDYKVMKSPRDLFFDKERLKSGQNKIIIKHDNRGFIIEEFAVIDEHCGKYANFKRLA